MSSRWKFSASLGVMHLSSEAGVSVALTNAETYYKFTGFTSGENINTIIDAANGTITIKVPGDYHINYTICYSMSGAASARFTGGAFKNGSVTTCLSTGSRSLNSLVAASSTDILWLNAGDVIDFRIKSDTAGVTITSYIINSIVTKQN